MSFYTAKQINELRTAAQFYKLDAPAEFWTKTAMELKKCCNGAGEEAGASIDLTGITEPDSTVVPEGFTFIGNRNGSPESFNGTAQLYDTAALEITLIDDYVYEGVITYLVPNGFYQGTTMQIDLTENGLTPDNIKDGITILGVTGNYAGSGPSIDATGVSDADPYVIPYGMTFIGKSPEDGSLIKVTGQAERFDGVNFVSVEDVFRDDGNGQYTLGVSLDDGFYSDYAVDIDLTEAGLDAANIKYGSTICTIAGTFTKEDTNPAEAGDILNGKIAFVNGTKVTGTLVIPESTGGTEFYECSSVISGGTIDPDKVKKFKLTGTINTTYEQKVFLNVEYIVCDDTKIGSARSWCDSNENFFLNSNTNGWSFWETSIADNTLTTTESNPFTANTWTGMDVESANLTFEILEYGDNESIPGNSLSWSGYKMVWNTDKWQRESDTPTEGLTVTGYTPEVGKVYSADTTIEIAQMFAGGSGSGGDGEATAKAVGIRVSLSNGMSPELWGDYYPVADEYNNKLMYNQQDGACCIVHRGELW